MALTPDEITLIKKLQSKLDETRIRDELHLRYYLGRQRLEQLGMAIPPSMRHFIVIANWPRVVVDTIESRQQVQALTLPGKETSDPDLRAICDESNFDYQLSMFNRDRLIYGRAFFSVSANPDNPGLPLIRAESPREMVGIVDPSTERLTAAARFFGVDENGQGPTNVTLFQPNSTVWMGKIANKWVELDRDDHELGRVPVVLHLNRRMSTGFHGHSGMADIIPLTDAVARSLTNLQFAQEAHGIPRMFASAVDKSDFVGKDGKPLPKWEAYFNSVWMLKNPQAKVGQLTAADLKNFETAIRLYGTQAATVTGFPARYFGITTVNPSAEGAINAEESQLVRSVEQQNLEIETPIGWVGALSLRFRTGEWVVGNRIGVQMVNPATPTVAQQTDAVMKMHAEGIISREGAWDELGWSEARKDRERGYLEKEAREGIDALKLGGDGDAVVGA